jgi:CDGSH-type Zn-finger protein
MDENLKKRSQAIIEVIDKGPLIIKGNFKLKDLKRDKEDSSGEVSLCLCRKSKNMPYCDDSHKI